MARTLAWDGCVNGRDLGGYATSDGARTRFGAIVRSDNPAYLSARGWDALWAYGIRTVVALRTVGASDDEPVDDRLPDGLDLVRVAVEDVTDRDFYDARVVNGLWGTPLYFSDALERWPARAAEAVQAVARAKPGGVLISCGRGCDRTGLLALLLLHLVGVSSADIAADYLLSRDQVPGFGAELQAALDRYRTSVDAAIAAVVAGPVAETLRRGRLTAGDIAALRRRFVEDLTASTKSGRPGRLPRCRRR